MYMKKIFFFFNILAFILLLNNSRGQSLLLEENFDYTVGQLTDVNSGDNVSGGNWINYNGTASPLTVSQGSLTYSGYASSGIGNKVEVWYGTAEDAYRPFTTQTIGSTIYAAFIMKVSQTTGLAANSNNVGDYTISFTPSTNSTTLVGRVSIKKGSVPNTFNLGIRATSSNSSANWISTDFPIDTSLLVVLKYELIDGDTNDVASLWVNPPIGTAEPAANVTQTSVLANEPNNIGRITLRQGTYSFPGQIDGIRVASTWEEAVKGNDNIPPVAVFNPPNDATDVPVNVTPTISFDEPIRNIDNTVIDNSNVASLITFKLTDATGADVPFTATIDNSCMIITIVPSSNLAYNQTYFLAIDSVEDANNNATTPQSINFTTIAENSEAEILTFDITGQISSTINSTNATVDIVMPYGSDVTNLIPTITVSPGATINPPSGVAQDFSSPVQYTVTAQNTITTKIWTVAVNVLPPENDTLVMWTFPNNPDDSIADGGISANLNKVISNNASAPIEFNYSGATTNSARSLGWDNGMNTKYWLISFTTVGYENITLSSKQRSSNTGPRDFKAQYSIDNVTWHDIANITVANNYTTGVLTDVSLPAECNNKTEIFVRWIMTSNTAVNNSLVSSAGASNIDDIYVKGMPYPLHDKTSEKEFIIVYPNPATERLYIYLTDKIFNTYVTTLDGKIIPISCNNNTIDIHFLNKGMYILNITTFNKTYKVNFIKQ